MQFAIENVRVLQSWFNMMIFNWSHSTGAFEDTEDLQVTHVEGEVDPVRDFDIIAEELRLKDVETLNKALEKIEKLVRSTDKKAKPEHVSWVSIPIWTQKVASNNAIHSRFLGALWFMTKKGNHRRVSFM